VLTSPAPRDRRRATQDHLLEVIFGHLAADSKPREYFDAMLTCVPSLAFSSATRETRAVVPRNQRDAVRDSTRQIARRRPRPFSRLATLFLSQKQKTNARLTLDP
jgi:hypothetical protein